MCETDCMLNGGKPVTKPSALSFVVVYRSLEYKNICALLWKVAELFELDYSLVV